MPKISEKSEKPKITRKSKKPKIAQNHTGRKLVVVGRIGRRRGMVRPPAFSRPKVPRLKPARCSPQTTLLERDTNPPFAASGRGLPIQNLCAAAISQSPTAPSWCGSAAACHQRSRPPSWMILFFEFSKSVQFFKKIVFSVIGFSRKSFLIK